MKIVLIFITSLLLCSTSCIAAHRAQQTTVGIDNYRLPFDRSLSGNQLDKKSTMALNKIGENLAAKFNLKLLSTGREHLFVQSAKRRAYCNVNFYSQHCLSINEAKKVLAEIYRDYVNDVLSDPILTEFLSDRSSEIVSRRIEFSSEEELRDYILKGLCIRITFWNDKFEYIPSPYVARIDVFNSKIKYYQLSPDSPYLNVFLEQDVPSYEETLCF